mgnify:CR=1 FL=1
MIYKKGVACNALFEKMENDVKKYDYVIWDFNGTLLSDAQLGVDADKVEVLEMGMEGIEE